MADNVAITAGSGTTVAADEVVDGTLGTVKVQFVKIMDGTLDGTTKATVGAAGLKVDLSGTAANSTAVKVDNSAVTQPTSGNFVTVSTDVTRPADTTAYAANDAMSDSTTTPTTGGFTFTSAARASGGSGIITDCIVTSSNAPSTLLSGEIWLFDSAVTNVNDNSAFAVSDTEIKTYVGKIPFTLENAGNNSSYSVSNLALGFTCVGTANLRYLIKVKNAYTPASAEVLTVRLKIVQIT